MRLTTAVARLIACLLSIFLASAASAENLTTGEMLEQIGRQLVRSSVLRANFEQEREMRVLKRPLVTRGEITVVADQGLLWRLREPHELILVMTPQALVEWTEAGEPRQLEMAASPIYSALTDTLLGILTGDTAALSTLFEPQPVLSDGKWTVLLTPRDSNLSSFITEIEIAGDEFVRTAVITEPSGDRTVIKFTDYRTEPAVLDPSEQTYFEQ